MSPERTGGTGKSFDAPGAFAHRECPQTETRVMAETLRHGTRLGLVGMAILLLAARAGAHTLPISFLQLVPDADYLHLELTLNPFELSFIAEVDANHNGRLEPEEFAGRQAEVAQRILDCLSVRVDGRPVRAAVAGLTPDLDSHHCTLRAHYAVDARGAPVEIESKLATITSGSHLTQVTWAYAGARQLAQLDTQCAKVTFAPRAVAVAAPVQHVQWPGLRMIALVLLSAVTITAALGWRRRRRIHPSNL